MIVSDEARVLFVHVQKTGGLSVEATLLAGLPAARRPEGGRHLPLSRLLADRPELADYWTFGFVRNPWARMWSWWSMIQRRGEAAAADPRVAAYVHGHEFWARALSLPDFEAFVLEGTRRMGRLRRPQIDYLRADGRTADFIGRTETLDADLVQVCARIGITPPESAERRNVGDPGSYRDHYTDRSRDRVGELFAADVDHFGYDF